MKSKQIVTNDDYNAYGDLLPMCSAEGWYVGSFYHGMGSEGEMIYTPGTRDSDYYKTFEEAQQHLDSLEAEAYE